MIIDLVVLGTGNADIIRLIEDINDDKKQYNFLGFIDKNDSLVGSNIFGYRSREKPPYQIPTGC